MKRLLLSLITLYQRYISPAFPGKNQRHLWFFENAYDDLRAVLHVES